MSNSHRGVTGVAKFFEALLHRSVQPGAWAPDHRCAYRSSPVGDTRVIAGHRNGDMLLDFDEMGRHSPGQFCSSWLIECIAEPALCFAERLDRNEYCALSR